MRSVKGDFAQGSVSKHIMSLAVPMTIAAAVQMLYSIVDRIYIGHLPGASSLALTGLGLTFPIISIVIAFTNLFGMGGAPLCSIARGERNDALAEKIMGSTFFMLCLTGALLMAVCYAYLKPLLYVFGASDRSYPYAAQYLMIYISGTPLAMIGGGMNGFINAQGCGRVAMMTTLLGAIANIILDPIFIFVFGMGVAGAAIASVISQGLSAAWVMSFLMGRHTALRLKKSTMKPDWPLVRRIMGLGLAGFIMNATNGAVQIACNMTLRNTGGDVFVGIMTVLNSLREVIILPAHGLRDASQPVLGYNYGARRYERIRRGILFLTGASVFYMCVAWYILYQFPGPLMGIFNSDPELIAKGVPSLHLYFFGFFMMALQSAGQSTFVALGQSRQAIFFSLFRKIVIVVPLTLWLPGVAGLGVTGVFLAEPISNFIGGAACYTAMIFRVRQLFKRGRESAAEASKG